MRTGLIAIGVIFLVLGAIAYFIPTIFSAFTWSSEGFVSTSYSSWLIPYQIIIALLIIGAVLLIFGLALPEPVQVITLNDSEVKDSEVIDTSEHIEVGQGKHKRDIVREKHEHHVGRHHA
ncbi:MAG: hypothetical protein Q7K45_03400 [Nanoarchaeota archaeon]|nr:hypothetical protein [Nanoarchaeota archaeon]